MEENQEETERRQNSGREMEEEEDKSQMNDDKWKRNETMKTIGDKKTGMEVLSACVKWKSGGRFPTKVM